MFDADEFICYFEALLSTTADYRHRLASEKLYHWHSALTFECCHHTNIVTDGITGCHRSCRLCASIFVSTIRMTSHERHVVSNHRPFDCLFNSLCRPTSKYTLPALCDGNSPVAGEFLAQRASNVEKLGHAPKHLRNYFDPIERSVLMRYNGWVNPLRAIFFSRNINTYLQFLAFFHTDMTQVAEILPNVRQGPT